METKLVLPAVEFAERSDAGRDPEKQVNEDASAYEETAFGHLCVLCDGMGGHQNGREAAELAVKAIVETFSNVPSSRAPSSPEGLGARARELLREAIEAANARVAALGGLSKQARPGATVVAILMHPEGVEVAHVGDSRCYLLQGGQIFQITKDHTVVQKMVDAGVLSPAEAQVHPDANQILRALGTSPEVEVEVRAQSIPLSPGEAFVLCSDGLSDLVQPQEILQIATAAPASQAVGELVDLANARGGHDNITVMILRGQEGNAAKREPAPTLAQTLFEVPAMPMVLPPSGPPHPGNVDAASQPAPTVPLPISSAPALPVPPPLPARRKGAPVVVVLGVLLAVVGFGAAGFAIFLLLDPSRDQKQVAPFALSGAPMTPLPSVALVPVAPESPPSPIDGSVSPLPSLTPPRPLRHGHGP
jgi:PPM family protein phosphatase